MNRNIPLTSSALQMFAAEFIDGLKEHGSTIGMMVNTDYKVRADLSALLNAESACQNSRIIRQRLTNIHAVADCNAKAFIAAAREIIATYLGERWSPSWSEAGFPNQSTEVPTTADERFELLDALAAVLLSRPGWEKGSIGITSDAASVLHQSLISARKNLKAHLEASVRKKQARVLAESILRKRLDDALSELQCLMTPNDYRWLSFGLQIPTSHGRPDAVENLTVAQGLPGTLLLEWPVTPHASLYRIWVKTTDMNAGVAAVRNFNGDIEIKWEPAVNSEFVMVHTLEESEITLTGMPSGKTVSIKVNAVNHSGDGPDGVPVEVVVP